MIRRLTLILACLLTTFVPLAAYAGTGHHHHHHRKHHHRALRAAITAPAASLLTGTQGSYTDPMTQLGLQWTPVTSSALKGYRFGYSTTDARATTPTWTSAVIAAGSASRPFVFSSLVSGATYNVFVEAVDTKGRAARTTLTGTTQAPAPTPTPTPTPSATPDAVPTPTITNLTQTSMTVNWQPPAQPGTSAVDGYQVGWGTWDSAMLASTARSAALNNFTADTTYTIRVRAHNASGYGTWSEVTVHTPAATPTTPTPTPTAHTWYVSKLGSNGDGASWASAWNELSAINWTVIQPGDTVLIDGGTSRCASPYDFTTTRPGVSCGMTYSTTLTVGRSGTATAPVTIRRASEPGRDGTVVLFGGRDVPLPYCHQASYTAPTGRSLLVNVNGQSYVTLDGGIRSGIMGYGAQDGVRFGSDSANHITLRNLELFDNGVPTTTSNGYNSDNENITLRGNNLTFDRLLVHDGGQDNFQDETHADGTLHDVTFQNTWIYFARENPQYPGYSFNEPQSTGCTHADGIQIWDGGVQSAITVDHVLFGPGGNQGLYPGDGVQGTRFNNVSITNTLFLGSASHNLISDLAVSGWTMDHDTIYAPQGGSEVPASGSMRLTNTIKVGGYWYAPGGTWTASGNISYGGDPLPGSTSTNPNFVGPIPTSSVPRFSELRAADFTPTCTACSTAGAPLHKVADILSWIDALNS